MDFIGKRKIWYILSSTLVLISLISLLVQGLNFGIDFQGGSLLHLAFEDSSVDSEKVRTVLEDFGLENSNIQESTDGSIVIKTVEMGEDRQEEILQAFTEKLGTHDLLRSEKVGPVIGSELRRAGLLALAIAAVLQILYITFRFEFKFGIAAILALLHDVFITTGFFSVFQIEVDTTFIAAILTIIGYSINDTIVIFDRIRENLRNRRKENLALLINNSIRQTIVRSINTSVAVLFVLVALIVLGGETTKNFSLGMMIDVIVGCYSSIFMASTLWYDFKPEEHKKGKFA